MTERQFKKGFDGTVRERQAGEPAKLQNLPGAEDKPKPKVTSADINKSYDLLALLQVCLASAEQINDDMHEGMEARRYHVDTVCALVSTLRIVRDMAGECHDVLEGAAVDR